MKQENKIRSIQFRRNQTYIYSSATAAQEALIANKENYCDGEQIFGRYTYIPKEKACLILKSQATYLSSGSYTFKNGDNIKVYIQLNAGDTSEVRFKFVTENGGEAPTSSFQNVLTWPLTQAAYSVYNLTYIGTNPTKCYLQVLTDGTVYDLIFKVNDKDVQNEEKTSVATVAGLVYSSGNSETGYTKYITFNDSTKLSTSIEEITDAVGLSGTLATHIGYSAHTSPDFISEQMPENMQDEIVAIENSITPTLDKRNIIKVTSNGIYGYANLISSGSTNELIFENTNHTNQFHFNISEVGSASTSSQHNVSLNIYDNGEIYGDVNTFDCGEY